MSLQLTESVAMCYRGTLLPDPRYDALRCIVLAAADDAEDMSDGNYTARVLLFHEKTTKLREGLPNVQVHMHAPCCLFWSCYCRVLPHCRDLLLSLLWHSLYALPSSL